MTLALQLPLYNGSRYLPILFASLQQQTNQDWECFVVEDSLDANERLQAERFFESHPNPRFHFFVSKENRGFSGGHQFLFEQHQADLIFLINQDTFFEPDFIEQIRRYMETHPDIGAATGKILRWHFAADGSPEKTSFIDSLGLVCKPSQKVMDRQTGKEDGENAHEPEEVFGVSGCLPFYKRSAVLQTSHNGQLFDPAYHSYKEDVDLAYRLRAGGWKSVVLPWVIAYHERTFQQSLLHKDQSYRVQFQSYRNHWWNLLTHLTWKDWLKNAWAILPFEMAKIGFFLFWKRTPSVLWKTWQETKTYWPTIQQKRLFWKEFHKQH